MTTTLPIAVLLIAAATAAPASSARAAEAPGAITLKQAVALALQHSPDLAVAEAERRVGAATVETERARFGPNFYTGTGAIYTYGFPQTPGGSTPSIVNLAYRQTVFDSASRGAVKAAQARLAGQSAGIQQTRDHVIAAAASAYLELATLRQAIDERTGGRDEARRIVDATRARVQAGRELPADMIRAELDAAQVEQSLVQLEGRAGIVEERLRTLIGAGPGQPMTVQAEALPAQPPAPVAGLVARALEASPALRQAEDERRARQAALGGAKGRYLPSVNLVGQYGLFGRYNNYDQFFQRFQRNNINVGVEVQVPIFSAETSAAAALAASQLAEAEAALTQQRDAIAAAVRDKARQARESSAALDVARLQARLAAETVRELAARAKAGLVNPREVDRARLKAGDANVAHLDASLAADQAELDLWTLTGQIEQLVP